MERGDDEEDLRGFLEGLGVEVFGTRSPAPRAHDAEERRAYRETLWRAHFAGSAERMIDARRALGPAWTPLTESERPEALTGAVAGMIGADGFCLGLGIVRGASGAGVLIETAVREREPASVRIARSASRTTSIGPRFARLIQMASTVPVSMAAFIARPRGFAKERRRRNLARDAGRASLAAGGSEANEREIACGKVL